MTVKELLLMFVLVAASVLLLLVLGPVTAARLDSPLSTVQEDVDHDDSVAARHRGDSGDEGRSQLVHGVPGDAAQSWTVRRRVSAGSASNVSDSSSSTQSGLTADQWRRRERSVSSPHHPVLQA